MNFREKISVEVNMHDYGRRLEAKVHGDILDLLREREAQIDELQAKIRTITKEERRQLFAASRKRCRRAQS
ncbi:hypothetical protein [uncultured Roseobacter sp.]|uniref:hypothetical protein n=1 Tax=uncultured Roseobacter sp. TaxID=114847 RepID=UPI0026371C7C|nr:hypothetical protein [uncultured Roseobacter sp.]